MNHRLQRALLFILFPLLLASCREKEEGAEELLLHKWQLIRVEQPLKIVSPPTDTLPVWIQFSKQPLDHLTASGLPYSLSGQSLLNPYFGAFKGNLGKSGSLEIKGLGSTMRGGPAEQMRFEVYYFSLLQQAASFHIQDNMLMIHSRNGERLIYGRITDF